MDTAKTLVVIAGPTAIGKTDLAIKIAQHLKTEILSADSRQFYREMSIGTAKPSSADLKAVKHHFIDSLSVTERYTAGDFESDALKKLDEIFVCHDYAVLVGGSGLFIKAVTEGFDDLPSATHEIREHLNNLFKAEGISSLQEQLKTLDSESYSIIDIYNPHRLIRALEVCLTTGKPFSSFKSSEKASRPFKIIKIGLDMERSLLYNRINLRVDQMISEGLVKEARSLIEFRHLNALQTVGYAELFNYFDQNTDLPHAIEAIKQNTRRFAKRQLTWFRKDQEIRWFAPDQYSSILSYISAY